MGQRAFRGRLTDSLIKNYLTDDNTGIEGYSTSAGMSNSIEETYFQGKLVDLSIEFNLDSPLADITDINTVLSKGLVNAMIPKGTKIKNLKLVIKSSLFGEGKTLLHSNLYVLFGSYFIRDIRNIYIKLYNPVTMKSFNDRKTISNILDFMCFKTIKCVRINKALLYYVIPEYSQFAIVLAYKDINFYEKIHFNFTTCLEDLLFHPYCLFERKKEHFQRCLGAIEKTVPNVVNNIILPVIYFNNLSSESLDSIGKHEVYFSDLKEFLQEILARFKIMSLELKVKFSDTNFDLNKNEASNTSGFLNSTNQSKFINQIINENLDILKKFTYSYISFDFDLNFNYTSETSTQNLAILKEFRRNLIKQRLTNVTLANHINYILNNSSTNLDDTFDFYDYIYYDKTYAEKIWTLLLIFKNKINLSKIYRKKAILENILKKAFSLDKIYHEGRINFSTEIVKNKKIVPFEVCGNNVMVFTN